MVGLMKNKHVEFFHPINFVLMQQPDINDPTRHPSDDVYMYGFSFDFTTELYWFIYDWGRGFNFRILGFGFSVTHYSL
jgi:hypothetical protein